MSGGNVTGVIELKLKLSLPLTTHKFESIMKKYIEISEEAVKALESNLRVDGSLKKDSKSGRLVFTDWKRKAPKYYKEKKVADLDFGFVGETEKHITRHEKFPKVMGTENILNAMDSDNIQSQAAVVDREIVDNA